MTLARTAAFVAALYACGFVVSRVHMFHISYTRRLQHMHSEEWLVQQCRSHEFYHNMKHHSSVCEDVAARADEADWLAAFDDVVRSTYLCGSDPCANHVAAVASWMAHEGFFATAGVVVVFLALLVLAVPCLRLRRFNKSKRDMHPLYLHHDQYHTDPYFRPQTADSVRDIHHSL